MSKEPGRKTSGDGVSACGVCQSPPLDEALASLMLVPLPDMRLSVEDYHGCCTSPPEENDSKP